MEDERVTNVQFEAFVRLTGTGLAFGQTKASTVR